MTLLELKLQDLEMESRKVRAKVSQRVRVKVRVRVKGSLHPMLHNKKP